MFHILGVLTGLFHLYPGTFNRYYSVNSLQ